MDCWISFCHLRVWGNCPACIDGNPDIAGIGVIIGFIGQAFIMNTTILAFHIWKFRHHHHPIGSRIRKALLISADAQTVTGIALTTAGLIQFRDLPLYHLAVILDLLSISANGHAIMYFYGVHQIGRAAETAEHREERQRWYSPLADPRSYVSLAYISILYAISALTYKRFDNGQPGLDCLLDYPSQFGNYGGWSLAEASLILVIYTLSYFQSLFGILSSALRRSKGFMGWLIPHLYEWFLPAFLVSTFICNLVDIIQLKIANHTMLNDDSEDNIRAFGQVVPIILLLLVLLQFWDLFLTKEVKS